MRGKIPPHWPPFIPDRVAILRSLTEKNEFIISDSPAFVAWYGDVPCVDLCVQRGDYEVMKSKAEARGVKLAGFVMTPVAPHFAINRSIVLTSAQSVRLEVVGDRPGVCVVDGVEIGSLKSGDSVTCRQHEQPLHVVTLSESSIGSRLRENLRQGHE